MNRVGEGCLNIVKIAGRSVPDCIDKAIRDKHRSRLRISVSAAHSEEDLEQAVQIIVGVLREEGICRP